MNYKKRPLYGSFFVIMVTMETSGPEVHADQLELDNMPRRFSELVNERIDSMMWHTLGGDLSDERGEYGEAFYGPLKERQSETLERNPWLREIYDLSLRAYEGTFPGVNIEILPEDTIFYIDDFERYSAAIDTARLNNVLGDYNYFFGLGYVNGEKVASINGQIEVIRKTLADRASEKELDDFIKKQVKYGALITILHEFIHATSHNIDNGSEQKVSYTGLEKIPNARVMINPETPEDRFKAINEVITDYLATKAVMLLGKEAGVSSQFAEIDIRDKAVLQVGKRIEEIIGELNLIQIYFSNDTEGFNKLLNAGNEALGLGADINRAKTVVDSIAYIEGNPKICNNRELYEALGLVA